MIGVFIVDSFLEYKIILAHAKTDAGIKGSFYLPPLNRKDTSGIKKYTQFFGILDETSGMGALLVAIDDDFEGEFQYSLRAYDFKAGSLSFNSHIHDAGEGTLETAAGPVTGVTGEPMAGV